MSRSQESNASQSFVLAMDDSLTVPWRGVGTTLGIIAEVEACGFASHTCDPAHSVPGIPLNQNNRDDNFDGALYGLYGAIVRRGRSCLTPCKNAVKRLSEEELTFGRVHDASPAYVRLAKRSIMAAHAAAGSFSFAVFAKVWPPTIKASLTGVAVMRDTVCPSFIPISRYKASK